MTWSKQKPFSGHPFLLSPAFLSPAPKCRYSPRELPGSIPFQLHKPWFSIFLVSSANFLSYCKREVRSQSPFPGGRPLQGHCLRFTPSPFFNLVHLSICWVYRGKFCLQEKVQEEARSTVLPRGFLISLMRGSIFLFLFKLNISVVLEKFAKFSKLQAVKEKGEICCHVRREGISFKHTKYGDLSAGTFHGRGVWLANTHQIIHLHEKPVTPLCFFSDEKEYLLRLSLNLRQRQKACQALPLREHVKSAEMT